MFIRMRLVWCMLVLSAKCSGSEEIPFVRADSSSTSRISGKTPDKAIDNNPDTAAATSHAESPAWLRLYFESRSSVEKVVVEHGIAYSADSVYTVSVFDEGVETLCGTFKPTSQQ